MKRTIAAFAAVFATAFAACMSAAHAQEAAIRKAVEPKLGGVRIESITQTPIPGIYEIQFLSSEGMQIIYSDSTGSYVLEGKLYDFRNERNLTDERLTKLNAIPLEKLPLDLAVKVQRGNGKRVIAMFTDPYCPYCQQFEKTLQQFDDITVYVFMFPVIRPENTDHSKAVWCSPDRAKAWLDLALNARRPPAPATCDNPVDKVLQLGRTLRIRSTPTVILTSGERFSGALKASDLRSAMDKAAAATAKSR
jgi:thiol:disulfide interchange protein DsbC